MGDVSASGLPALVPVPPAASLRGQHRVWQRGWPFSKGTVCEAPGTSGSALASLLTLLWPSVQSEEGGESLGTWQAQILHILGATDWKVMRRAVFLF